MLYEVITDSNMLDIELAKSVGPFFRLSEKKMNTILDEVKSSVFNWQRVAKQIGIPRSEQAIMAAAFGT